MAPVLDREPERRVGSVEADPEEERLGMLSEEITARPGR